MIGWIQVAPSAEVIDAVAKALHWTGYLPETMQDEFHTRVAAEVLVRELRALGCEIIPGCITCTSATTSGSYELSAVGDVAGRRKGA